MTLGPTISACLESVVLDETRSKKRCDPHSDVHHSQTMIGRSSEGD